MKKELLMMSVLTVALASCGQNASKTTEIAVSEEKVPEVTVSQAVMQKVEHTQTYTATVEAFAVNNIAPQSGGRIQKINVEVGDFVKAGDILAEMDKVNLEQQELQMKNNQIEYERLKGLYEVGGLSKSDLDAIELRYEVSKTSYENILENTILRSPISGVVSARNYDRGDMFSMGQPIYTVQQITPVKLNIGVSEGDYTKVKKGDIVKITVEAFPEAEFTGRVNRLDPTIDSSTHTVNVEVVVDNKDQKLRPGMFARVEAVLSTNISVVIPDTAVQKQTGAGDKYVYILNSNGTVSYRAITVGRRVGAQYEVLSGIAEGEIVVTSGHSAIRDGVKVNTLQ